MDYIDPKLLTWPNTAGCFNSKEALRTPEIAREIEKGKGNQKFQVIKNLFQK